MAQLIEEGHEIGNHLTEDRWSIWLSEAELREDVTEAGKILARFALIRWLRPGGGFYSHAILKIAAENGYRVVLGSVFPYDTHIPSVWFASRFILARTRPGDILVLHDGGARGDRTAKTLSQILPQLQRRGYEIVSLSTLVDSAL
ncbi:MAG: polysaccharide deacetylase family protein [Chloroflexaceae bacterium]|nr:polysaccharide deacetylase family protein [Chloroflexaceae bacterium]